MTRSGLAAGIVLQALAFGIAGEAARERPSPISPVPIGTWTPDEEGLAFRADLATAMAHYRWLGEEGLAAQGYRLWRKDMPFEMRWFWAAEDGGAIRRVGDGMFRITRTTRHRDWFFNTNCYAIGWPLFACDDGWERQMSAPDLSTIIFDDVRYTRILTVSDTSPPADESGPDVE